MKKTIVLLACCWALLSTTVSAQSGGTAGPLIWAYSNYTLTISGYGDMPDYSEDRDKRPPWAQYEYDIRIIVLTHGVTGIGEHAFSTCRSLAFFDVSSDNANFSSENGVLFNKNKSVLIQCPHYKSGNYVIPSSVTSLGDYAFRRCFSLTSITIPASITSIKDYAFFRCEALTSITIPNSVTSIGDYAFWMCWALTSITIPNSVTSIGDYAFSDCRALTSITIPGSVTSIGDYAFYSCSSLTSITIPGSVTSIGDYAFYSCSSLTSVTISNGVTSIGNYAFAGCSNLISITIPNGVTSIGNGAFGYDDEYHGCSNLISITIPSSVTSIGDYAFYGCSSLTSITIPSSVTSIGNYAFGGCFGLTSINVESDNAKFSSEDGVLFNKNKSVLICYPRGKGGDYLIPYGVTGIRDNTFSYCSSLTSITIPSSVTSIGGFAFLACTSLTSITIPSSVTSIGFSAFSDCSSLTSITIPSSVTSIGDYAFSCSLISITVSWNVPINAVFSCINSSTTLYVPSGTKSAYQICPPWNQFNIVEYTPTLLLSPSTGNSLTAYPNPTNGPLTIESDHLRTGDRIEIYTTGGTLVRQYRAEEKQTVLDISSLDKGAYLVKVKEERVKILKTDK
jgi:hypothetical protein